MTDTNPLLNAAKQYLRLGLHPIPCEPRGKRPLVPWKDYQQTPPTEEQLDTWWMQTPDANVAVVLGRGVFAVDLDGGDNAEQLLTDAGIELPLDAPRSKTAHGAHIFLSASGPVPDRVGLLSCDADGKKAQVDIRGVGYVVAPPSIHPTGAVYRWETSFNDIPPASPPKLLELISRHRPADRQDNKTQDWITQALQGVSEGQRDVTCTRLAGYLLHKGLPVEVVSTLLTDWGERCQPAFPAEDVQKCIESIARREVLVDDSISSIVTPLGEVLDRLVIELQNTKPTMVRSPFPKLNEHLAGGFMPGELVYMGGRPGTGKTALALEMARSVAQEGAGVLIVSREMINTALVRRLLSQAGQIRALHLRSHTLEAPEWATVHATVPKLKALPIWLTDSAVSIQQIEEAVAGFTPGQLGFLIVDYLQLVRPPRSIQAQREGVEYISKTLKSIAVQYQMPVLCLSSLSRGMKTKDGKLPKPSLSDLRESGELEHDADIVVLLHREWDSDICEFNLAKARDGKVGIIQLHFRAEFVSFEEIAG